MSATLASVRRMAIAAAVLASASIAAGPPCPVSDISAGFGANGPHPVRADSIVNPEWKDGWVHVFYPADSVGPFPAVLFCHGIGGSDPGNYRELIEHLVSTGNTVIYASFPAFMMDPGQKVKYDIVRSAFESAMRVFAPRIDTARIGIVGHSYGGGAVPAIAWWALNEKGWGHEGAYLYIMAPWYSFEVTQDQLDAFPENVCMIVETFEDDFVNDPRMAVDIFHNVNIPDSDKCFVTLRRDTRFDCNLRPDHSTPNGSFESRGVDDALDRYGIFRPLDALRAWAFAQDPEGRHIALGEGDSAQTFMGRWPDGAPVTPRLVTRQPEPSKEQTAYLNFWQNAINPRVNAPGSDTTYRCRTRAGCTLRTIQLYFKAGRRYVKQGRQAAAGLKKTTGPVPPIMTGYGSNGQYEVVVDTFPSPLWHSNRVYVFHPKGVAGRLPVIFFCHGYSVSNPLSYLPLIDNIVSRGYVLVFSPYRSTPVAIARHNRYALLEQGFVEAMKRFSGIIDSTRIGFVGHSYGAGAEPALALEFLNDRHWGAAGSFLFMMAPWYSFEITQKQLEDFPSSTGLVMEIFDNDRMNDPRMAIDIFTSIGIDRRNKDFVVVRSDTADGKVLYADHNLPKGPWDRKGRESGLEYYGIFKLVDALADLTFAKNEFARAVALGHGGEEQVYAGRWPSGRTVKPLLVTDDPANTVHESGRYNFRWTLSFNPRRRVSPVFAELAKQQ